MERKTLVKDGREAYVDTEEAETALRAKGFIGADEAAAPEAEEADEPAEKPTPRRGPGRPPKK